LSVNRIPLVWSLIHIAVLLLTFTPLGLFSISFLMVPAVVQFVKTKPPVFAGLMAINVGLTYAAAMLLGWNGVGPASLMLALFFLIPSIVMGALYKRQSPAHTVLLSGGMVLLAQLLLLFLILYFLGINITTAMRNFMQDSMKIAEEMMQMQVPQEAVDMTIQLMTQAIPVFLIVFSVYYVVVTHAATRFVFRRSAGTIPALRPISTWKLPKSFVWYYLIALVLSFLFMNDTESIVAVLLLNLIPLLMLAFAVQAVSFLLFVAKVKRWSRGLLIGLFVIFGLMFLFIPPMLQIVALVGVFDVAFPLRDRLRNSN